MIFFQKVNRQRAIILFILWYALEFASAQITQTFLRTFKLVKFNSFVLLFLLATLEPDHIASTTGKEHGEDQDPTEHMRATRQSVVTNVPATPFPLHQDTTQRLY